MQYTRRNSITSATSEYQAPVVEYQDRIEQTQLEDYTSRPLRPIQR